MAEKETYKGKIFIEATLTVLTGLHIGSGSDYAPIGAVDSPVIRDPLTHTPIIPGSSIKGKIRTLLAKYSGKTEKICSHANDNDIIKRLFGSSNQAARLQFFDLFMNAKSKEFFANIETDTYIGEIKFENTINRVTGVANPRQIERVPSGAKFDFRLVYNIENVDEEEIDTDMKTLAEGFKLLAYDYLGGHGSRGYGRVTINNFSVKPIGADIKDIEKYTKEFEQKELL